MKIAFCSVSGPDDRSYWSGTPYFMATHLRAALPDLDFRFVGPLQLPSNLFRAKHTVYTRALHQNYLWELEPILHRCLSAEVDRRLADIGGVDLVISPGCLPYPNIFLETQVPVVFWGDATFEGLRAVHPGYRDLCAENVWCGEHLQELIVNRSALSVFASAWAAGMAGHRGDADRRRTRVVPFGANLHFTIEGDDHLARVLSDRGRRECRLLLVARQWQTKGGALALAVLDAVRAAGLDCTLTVAGCEPPEREDTRAMPHVRTFPGFVKDAGESERAYARLLAASHFLLHPSLGDCYGVTMCEAAAWAVPVLARDTGGAGAIVDHGVTGYRLPPDAGPDAYAHHIVTTFSDERTYMDFCRRSWQRYQSTLNWPVSAASMANLLEGL